MHKVMNLGCHGLADYSVRGWQHLPEVLHTGFFSASNVTIFVFRLAVKPPRLLLTEREYEDKENVTKGTRDQNYSA